jgi:hypothetical protein
MDHVGMYAHFALFPKITLPMCWVFIRSRMANNSRSRTSPSVAIDPNLTHGNGGCSKGGVIMGDIGGVGWLDRDEGLPRSALMRCNLNNRRSGNGYA